MERKNLIARVYVEVNGEHFFITCSHTCLTLADAYQAIAKLLPALGEFTIEKIEIL